MNVTLPELLGLAVLGAGAWFWLDSLRVREAAVAAARAACAAEGLLLLDDTVAIARLGVARDRDGQLRFRRAYEFEYSDTGDNRLRGGIVLAGREVVLVNVGPRLRPVPRSLH